MESYTKKTEKSKLNKDWALLYGVLLGDGCLCKYKRKDRKNGFFNIIAITGDYKNDKKFFDNVLIPLISKLRNKQTSYKSRKKDGRIDFYFNDKVLFDRIYSLGFPIGKKNNLLIPSDFSNLMQCVVSGLFATDGCLALVNNNGLLYPRLIIKMTSKNLLRQVFAYLTKIGLKGNFYTCKLKNWPKNHKQAYWICFNGADNLIKFNKKIRFINPKHRDRYNKYLKYRKNIMH